MIASRETALPLRAAPTRRLLVVLRPAGADAARRARVAPSPATMNDDADRHQLARQQLGDVRCCGEFYCHSGQLWLGSGEMAHRFDASNARRE